jgi:hypothetical protein
MNKLIPFNKFSKNTKKIPSLSHTSVVVDEKGNPLGFVFGRDSFISLLENFDEAFEQTAKNQKQAYENPAGKLIDLIEEKLPLNPDFVKKLKTTVNKTKKQELIPLEEIMRTLHV